MVVAGEHGDRGHAAVAGGFDVVGHVADEGGFGGVEAVGVEEAVDELALVEHAGVGGFEVVAQAEIVHLALEGERVHGGEDKRADAECGAPLELFAGVGQHGDRGDGGGEGLAEVGFQFVERHLRKLLGVEFPVRQPERAAESLAVERSDFVVREHGVGGFEDRAEVVHQRAGPVEDEVAKHGELNAEKLKC